MAINFLSKLAWMALDLMNFDSANFVQELQRDDLDHQLLVSKYPLHLQMAD
jgi:hypothetical protein